VADYSRTSGGYSPAVSPDGKTVAYMSSEGEIWILPGVDVHDDQYAEPWRLEFIPEDNGQLAPSFFDLRHARNLDWSPDGRRLAIAYLDGRLYAAESFNFDSKTARVRTIVSDRQLDTKNNRAFALGMPRWSPDGTRIAFARESGIGRASVLVTDVSAGRVTKIADDAVPDSTVWGQPWSPDGKWLAYGSTKGVSGSNRAMVVSMSGKIRLVASSGPSSRPDWSLGSGRLAFATDKDTILKLGADLGVVAFPTVIAVSDRDREADRPLTHPGTPSLAQTEVAGKAALSRIRDRLLSEFASALTPGQKSALRSSKMDPREMCNLVCLLCARAAGGGVARALDKVAGKDLGLGGGKGSISAALKAAMSSRDIPGEQKNNFLRRISQFLSGIAPAQWQGQFEFDSSPVWSPDGKKIAFVRSNRMLDQQRLCILDVATGREREVFRTREVECVMWSHDGKLLVLQSKRLMGVNTTLGSDLQVQRVATPGYPEIWMLQVVPDKSPRATAHPAPAPVVQAAAPTGKAVAVKGGSSSKLQSIYIAACRVALQPSGSHRFRIFRLDGDGKGLSISSGIVWKANPAAGKIGPDGSFTAAGAVGVYRDAITVNAGGKTATATVEILSPAHKGGYVLEKVIGGTVAGVLSGPLGVAVDKNGFVFVADTENHAIQKFSASGKPLTFWGKFGSGRSDFGFVRGVAVDGYGNVIAVDNAGIRKFDTTGRFVARWQHFRPEGAAGNINPSVACDRQDNIYVANGWIGGVVKYDPAGKIITHWGSRGSGNGEFGIPSGIAVDSKGYVYVVDQNNCRVQKFDSSGIYVSQWGSRGVGDTFFARPTGIAIDNHDRVFVTDEGSSSVQVFDTDGNFIRSFAGGGAGAANFGYPTGIAIDKNGRVFVADSANNRVQILSSDGKFIGSLGNSGVANGVFRFPDEIAVDAAGNIYVSEANGTRVRKLDRTGCHLGTFDIAGMACVDAKGDCYAITNDGLAKYKPSGELVSKVNIGDIASRLTDAHAVDPAGHIWSVCQDASIVEMDASGKVLSRFDIPGLAKDKISAWHPWSIAVGANGGIYLVDNDFSNQPVRACLRKFDRAGKPVFTWVKGEGVMADARNIFSATVDPAGNIYAICAMDDGCVVKKIDPTGRLLDQIELGTFAVRRIAVSADGRIYLPNWGDGTVSIYAPSPLSGRRNPGQATTKTIMEVSGK